MKALSIMHGGENMTIEIYWDDLTEEKQNEIRKMLNMDSDDNGNWDIIPMASMEIERDS